jgi:hypothetical protein
MVRGRKGRAGPFDEGEHLRHVGRTQHDGIGSGAAGMPSSTIWTPSSAEDHLPAVGHRRRGQPGDLAGPGEVGEVAPVVVAGIVGEREERADVHRVAQHAAAALGEVGVRAEQRGPHDIVEDVRRISGVRGHAGPPGRSGAPVERPGSQLEACAWASAAALLAVSVADGLDEAGVIDVRPGADGGVELGGDRAPDTSRRSAVDRGEHVVVRGGHDGQVERGVGVGERGEGPDRQALLATGERRVERAEVGAGPPLGGHRRRSRLRAPRGAR